MPQPALALRVEDVCGEVPRGGSPPQVVDFGMQPVLSLRDETNSATAANVKGFRILKDVGGGVAGGGPPAQDCRFWRPDGTAPAKRDAL